MRRSISRRGKTYELRQGDIRNFLSVSHNDTVVFMDEVCNHDFVSGKSGASCGDISKNFEVESVAYRESVMAGKRRVLKCIDTLDVWDGFCVGQFVVSPDAHEVVGHENENERFPAQ